MRVYKNRRFLSPVSHIVTLHYRVRVHQKISCTSKFLNTAHVLHALKSLGFVHKMVLLSNTFPFRKSYVQFKKLSPSISSHITKNDDPKELFTVIFFLAIKMTPSFVK